MGDFHTDLYFLKTIWIFSFILEDFLFCIRKTKWKISNSVSNSSISLIPILLVNNMFIIATKNMRFSEQFYLVARLHLAVGRTIMKKRRYVFTHIFYSQFKLTFYSAIFQRILFNTPTTIVKLMTIKLTISFMHKIYTTELCQEPGTTERSAGMSGLKQNWIIHFFLYKEI